ncbi:hypothetical protein [Paenibacillus apiarius]|uniref:hypothetical protein n=1 Tax=Paenibacillus apiarius TaxID=46240 RepID=UPI003B3BBFAE
MPYEAKTDWKYDDTVTEKDLNRIEQGLKDAHVAEREALTLSPGVQVVEVENDTPFNFGSVKGRTLINLLGFAGSCDDLSQWLQHSEAGEPSYSIDDQSIKIVTDVADTNARVAKLFRSWYLKTGGFYIALADVKCSTIGECGLYVGGSETVKNTTTAWETLHVKLAVEKDSDRYIVVGGSKQVNVITYVDNVRVYEVSEAEYNAIGSMTAKQVAARYPYVDAMTNVRNPYVAITGENLLPPFSDPKSTIIRDQASVNIITPYELEVIATVDNQFTGWAFPIQPNTTYTFTCEHDGMIAVGWDITSYVHYTKEQMVTFNSGDNNGILAGRDICYVWFSNSTLPIGKYRFKNPMLTIGTEPKPFAPQQRSMWAAECDLAANPVDGSDPDVLFMGDDGLPYMLEKWKKVTLDGSLEWAYDTPYTEFKRVRIDTPFSDAIPYSQLATKYDGKVLPNIAEGVDWPSGDISQLYKNKLLFLSISNTDSGWGPDYTPTADEIKAYFLGWKMYDTSGADPTAIGTYNRTDGLHKGWTPLQSYDGNSYEGGYKGSGTPNTIPSTANTTHYSVRRTWQPYRLQYLKAKATAEPVRNYETGATLCKGANMVEVGSGIVIREKANPYGNYINAINAPGGRLKYRTTRLLEVYQNQTRDFGWTFKDGVWNGESYQYAENPIPSVDAVYHATYTMLDPTLAAPISGTMAANLRGTVSDLVQDVGDMERRLSVVETQKGDAEEDTGWIKVTPLNGWIHYAANPCRFRLQGKKLKFVGILQQGTNAVSTAVCQIPVTLNGANVTYRLQVPSWSSTETKSALIAIDNSGKLFITNTPSSYFIGLDGIELEADWMVKK